MSTEVLKLMKDICSWLQSNVWLPYSLNQMHGYYLFHH